MAWFGHSSLAKYYKTKKGLDSSLALDIWDYITNW